MGCRCCKMIHSYLFDPVQAPSPGYVNEVNSCKLDEEDPVKLKGKQSSGVQVHNNDLQGEGLRRTASRSRPAGPQEPCCPLQGPSPQGDRGDGHSAEKTGSAVNGIGPAAALQPPGDPGPQQGGTGSWASTTNSVHPTSPFLDGGDPRETDWALQALEETRVAGHGDSRVPSKGDCPPVEVQDHVLQLPAPDYPQCWGSAGDSRDHEEKDYLFRSDPEEEPLEEMRPDMAGQGLNMPFSVKRSWDSLNEAVAAEVLSVYFKEEDPAQAMPVAHPTDRWEGAPGCAGDRAGGTEDEDAEVAEALAALEAATAGEDLDEAD
ncbi:uncharacterized protein C4orf19 homolog [Pteronotus mesoamericanus]|uniref:uncharacterized protein C4orf19 homolog n=1 Tax=Pteronotus mesoamericanus TaxID=1884717 RepID=UPI0023EB4266|nr:uncharacterized protein C4orf19 homolog [Pteronotus parnellii mesoamericanus]XP_054438002.1 uncharacterized protein C4orf19 homolog [Pteronotus parnellii mesoamericanus]XP_054438003.1 uncharacterized protein C4orf19 homolog [Pteronotus parnellii mesoamericanus]XP_054438004.1 uncharacterized protein C4orf19 homolog [Pteronotus parnellii mesoamericanus]XP_054438005.1 uncharacterized protein C4orf19 homolog [Pteronotus parnellii mesoamericanus]XP_054438006.1 uncharacterized protein C4orf19 hom